MSHILCLFIKGICNAVNINVIGSIPQTLKFTQLYSFSGVSSPNYFVKYC